MTAAASLKREPPSVVQISTWVLAIDFSGAVWIGDPADKGIDQSLVGGGFLLLEPAYRFSEQMSLDHTGAVREVVRTAFVPGMLISARKMRVRPASIMLFSDLAEEDLTMLRAIVVRAEASRPKTHGEKRLIGLNGG